MMKEILINVSRETKMVDLNKSVIGNDGESLQSKLVFTFIDEFVNGQARLEYEIKGSKNYVVLDKENNTYTIPVKNVITKEGQIDMQLVITEGVDEEEIPVFKSNKFYLFCNSSINAVEEAPDGYELWIEQANVLLNQIENIDIDIEDNVVTITKKDGTVKSENVKGEDYIITEEDLDEIETNVKSDIQPILDEAKENSETAISISKGANQALSFGNYATMISVFNELNNDIYRTGQNILIVTLNVPDLWISEVLEESTTYTYTTDEDFANLLKEQGYVQVGYYKLSALETQKVDLTDYVKNTDYATSDKGGVVKTDASYNGINVNNSGFIFPSLINYVTYQTKDNNYFISKGTLENVLNARFVTLTQAEYDALTTKDENTYYNIVEE